MADFITSFEEDFVRPGDLSPSPVSMGMRTPEIGHRELSPGPSSQPPKQVLVVMDGLREFSWEPLEWILKNVADGAASCIVTLLGITPWLNIPLSSKTWADIWSIDVDDLSVIKEGRNDPKYHKVRALLDICHHYGVVLEIRSMMGHPLHLLVLEQISTLHASLVVFDRHHDNKFIAFYAEKIPCTIVKMKEDGGVDRIKTRSVRSAESTPARDDASFNVVAPSSRSVVFSEQIKKLIKRKYVRSRENKQGDEDVDQASINAGNNNTFNRAIVRKSKSVLILPGEIRKLLKRSYVSFGKKNTETAPFGACLRV